MSLAGCDSIDCYKIHHNGISTHTSLAGRDVYKDKVRQDMQISTHTSLAGRDQNTYDGSDRRRYFYSHVPRGT